MVSGSKYETMAKAIEKKIEELNKGTDDLIKQKKLEQAMNRIDKETERKIKELKATPIDNEQIKKEAKSNYDRRLILTDREYNAGIINFKQQLENLEMGYKRQKESLETQYSVYIVDSKTRMNFENERAKQEYDRELSSINNMDDLMNLKIEQIRDEAEKQKQNMQIDLDNVKAINDSKSEKMKCLDKLYDDIKEISLKLGDNNHTK